MLVDNSNGYLYDTLKFALDTDIEAQEQSDGEGMEVGRRPEETMLHKFAEMLAYLHSYGTSRGDTEPPDPLNCIVTLFKSRDCGEHSFDVVWRFRKKLDHKPESTKDRILDREYDYFMNGGLVYFPSDRTWSVHT